MKRRTTIFILLLLCALVPFIHAQGSTLGLSAGDYDLFNAANAASASISASQFEFSLSFSTSGIPDANVSIDLQGSGAFDTSGASPLLQLALDGTASVPEETPIQAEVRVVDGVVYVNLPDEATGAQTWQGMSVDDLTSLAESSGAVPGLPQSGAVDPAELSGAMMAAFATLDPSEFITISRMNDEAVDGVNTTHFRSDLSLTDFVSTEAFGAMLSAAASAGDATDISPTDMSSMGQMVSMMVSNSSITFDQFFGEEDELLRRAALNIDVTINGAMMGMTEPVSIAFNFAIDLTDLNQPQTIVAPEGVEITSLPDTGDLIAAAPTITVEIPTVDVPTVIVPTIETLTVLPTATPTTEPPAAVIPTAASSTETIAANTPVEIQLTGSGAIDLVYLGNANEVIGVTARSLETDGTVDTTLEVLDSNNIRLSYNDDHGSDRTDLDSYDSYIRDLKLTSSGEVLIRVNSFSGVASGRVEVLVTSGSAAAPTPTTATQTSGPEVITGSVPADGTFDHAIGARQGEILTITVRSTDGILDPKVALVDLSGTILIENDDHGTDDPSLDRYDSRITDFTLPSGGTFTIQVSGFGGSGGTFELTIERKDGGGVVASATPLAAQTPGGTTATTQTVQGSIRPNDTFTYVFEAQAGDVYTITVRAISSDFDPRVSVYDQDENFLFSNDDHGTTARDIDLFDSRISSLILPDNGSYTINVNGYQDSAGDFELIVEQVATGAPTGRGTDEVFTGEIRANSTFTQTFDAQAGEYVTISVRALSQDFDPRVALLSPGGVIVADNDDHSSSAVDLSFLDSRISNFLITESGTYTVEVQGFQGSAGSFALTITTLR